MLSTEIWKHDSFSRCKKYASLETQGYKMTHNEVITRNNGKVYTRKCHSGASIGRNGEKYMFSQ